MFFHNCAIYHFKRINCKVNLLFSTLKTPIYKQYEIFYKNLKQNKNNYRMQLLKAIRLCVTQVDQQLWRPDVLCVFIWRWDCCWMGMGNCIALKIACGERESENIRNICMYIGEQKISTTGFWCALLLSTYTKKVHKSKWQCRKTIDNILNRGRFNH